MRLSRAVQDRILWIHIIALELAVDYLAKSSQTPAEQIMVKLLAEAQIRFGTYSHERLEQSCRKILKAMAGTTDEMAAREDK
jgi:hypothetical protein